MFQAILLVSLFNGLASPAYQLLYPIVRFNVLAFPGIFSGSGEDFLPQVIVLHVTSLVLAFGTMFLAGVPAALYERFARLQGSDQTSMTIWLAGTVFLSFPAIGRFL